MESATTRPENPASVVKKPRLKRPLDRVDGIFLESRDMVGASIVFRKTNSIMVPIIYCTEL